MPIKGGAVISSRVNLKYMNLINISRFHIKIWNSVLLDCLELWTRQGHKLHWIEEPSLRFLLKVLKRKCYCLYFGLIWRRLDGGGLVVLEDGCQCCVWCNFYWHFIIIKHEGILVGFEGCLRSIAKRRMASARLSQAWTVEMFGVGLLQVSKGDAHEHSVNFSSSQAKRPNYLPLLQQPARDPSKKVKGSIAINFTVYFISYLIFTLFVEDLVLGQW